MTDRDRKIAPCRAGRRHFLAWNLLSALAVLMGPFIGKPADPRKADRPGTREAKFYTRLEQR
jgi:hypothetical protein